MHTFYSDGTRSTDDLVRMAREAGLRAISLTDHDTVEGVDEITEKAAASGIEVLPGVELSTNFDGVDLHLLGYCMDHHDPEFRKALDTFRSERQDRAQRIVDRLRELGLEISMEAVREVAGDAVLGRPHIARALTKLGIVSDVEDAFQRYIGPGKPGYVEKYKFHTLEAIQVIQKAGGLAVLAHPGTAKDPAVVEKVVEAGVDGLEINHPRNSEEDEDRCRRLVEQNGLVETGGSDFHGDPDRPGEAAVGERSISYQLVEELKRRSGAN